MIDCIPSIPTLIARNLCKDYGAQSAVREISFEINEGEVLGVVGPNGAGKSTIVRIITGLLEPDRGQVLFRGEPIAAQYDRFRQSLGYVPEQADVYGFLTGWEYLELVCGLRGMDRRVFRRRSLALFDAFRLGDARHRPMGGYSKGMRQRIALMTALIHNPVFMVLDEPFSGLDVTSALVLHRVIRVLAARGKAILFSSPSLEHLEQVSSRLLLLRSGSVVASGSLEEITRLQGGATLTENFQVLTESADPNQTADEIAAIITET